MANKLNNTTAGLAGLLQGINSGRQQTLQNQIAIQQLQNQNQTTQWANPYRAPGELDRLKVDSNPIHQLISSAMSSGAIPGLKPQNTSPAQAIGAVVGQGQANMDQAKKDGTPVPVDMNRVNSLIEELYQARKAKGGSNA